MAFKYSQVGKHITNKVEQAPKHGTIISDSFRCGTGVISADNLYFRCGTGVTVTIKLALSKTAITTPLPFNGVSQISHQMYKSIK